jgi:hypothetical protein
VAVAIAKAKLASCKPEEPLAIAESLINNHGPVNVPQTRFFRAAFAPKTLRSICSLREGLLRLDAETDATVVLRAAVLGCLHGPLSKDLAQAGYFSNQMPRTYASKPSYAVRYWKEKALKPPKVDVLEVLRRKLNRIARLTDKSPSPFRQVLLGDSRKTATYSALPHDQYIVVTSPPYYGMRTYVQDQWLRNWFLGGPQLVDYRVRGQLEHGGQSAFAKSLGEVWANISKRSLDTVHMYVRFGTIPSSSVDAKELFKASLKSSEVDWRIVSVRSAATADLGKRQAGQMNAKSQAALEFDFHVERA